MVNFSSQNQKGIVHLYLLIAVIGIIAFLGITSLAPLKDQLLGSLFPKSASQAATQVPKYGVFETTLAYSTVGITNPWDQVLVTATFTSPSNKTLTQEGFYYDPNTFMVRFTPAEVGIYNYSITITGPNGNPAPITGSFESVASSNKGFIRKLPGSNTRFVFEDGSFFNGVGFNYGWTSSDMIATLGDAAIEPSQESKKVYRDEFFWTYNQKGGYNLFRCHPTNGCPSLGESINLVNGNSYDLNLEKQVDALLESAKNNGFHTMYTYWNVGGPFGYDADFTTNTAKQNALKKAIRHYIARYGAYVDMWEIGNENEGPGGSGNITPDSYLTFLANYTRSVDPYQRMVTNSNERTNDSSIGLDFTSNHWYGPTYDWYDFPLIRNFQMIPGEIGRGNGTSAYNAQYTATMRMTNWTGVFGGMGLIYWNISSVSTGNNAYLGSNERLHNRVMVGVTGNLDGNSQASKITNFTGTNKFGYKLTGTNTFAAYIYDNRLTTSGNTSTSFSANVPFSGTAQWIDPKTGNVLQTFSVNVGAQTFTTPTFTEDIALKITTFAPTPILPALPTPSFTPVPQPTIPPAPIPSASPNLLLYSTLDNASSVTSPTNGTGTGASVNTTPANDFVTGHLGNGIRINATGDYVRFPQINGSTKNVELDKGTLDFWYQPNYNHTDGIRHPIVSIGNFAVGGGSIHLEKNNASNGDILTAYVFDSTGSPASPVAVLRNNYSWNAGDWLHLRLTWDFTVAVGTPSVRIYVNDVEKTPSNTVFGPKTMPAESSSNYIYLGTRNSTGSTDAQGAVFDELKIYDQAFPPAISKKGDFNNSGTVNVLDLSVLLSNWNATGSNPADLNNDSKVNVLDLSVLLTNWG